MKDGFQKIITEKSDANLRLDQILTKYVSRRKARKLLDHGAVFINGGRCKIASKKIQPGNEITFPMDLPQPPVEFNPEEIILGDNHNFLAIDKPRNWPTAPTPWGDRYCIKSVMENFTRIKDLYIFQRLDFHTTGVLVFAKSISALKIAEKSPVEKIYTALVSRCDLKPGMIDLPIGPSSRRERYIVSSDGKKALTEILSVTDTDEYSLIRVKLHTGRTHQIRVHLSYLGFPVIGDPWYGENPETLSPMMLHSTRFSMNYGKEHLTFSSELPSFWPNTADNII
ncbi:MAG: RluA family pseudouridine synthase [Deltaproteobacteria bacterium]|nr:RluA family pseudouridine synthase [Deltaproteobacteria bacterium]